MKNAHCMIYGFIQGVGYRKWVKKEAQKLGVTGWIRNLPDGSVEALLQGTEDKQKQLITLCKKGPFLADVEKVDIVWEEEKEKLADFNLRHDF